MLLAPVKEIGLNVRGLIRVTVARLGALAALCMAGVMSQPAQAALGDKVESVARDREALRGSLVTRQMSSYEVHELTAGAGTTVREYVAPAGGVFAVTWSGAHPPDLKLLLGEYFSFYVAGARAHRGSHHVLSLDTPDLTLTVVRYQRKAAGQAYVPGLMPAGVSREELR